MAFADPQTVTVNLVANSLPRVSTTGLASKYQKNDQSFTLEISHAPSKGRIRSMAKLTQRAIVPDPLTAVNDYETLIFYVVVDRPEVGFSAAQQDQLITGFKTWLGTGTSDKLFGMES